MILSSKHTPYRLQLGSAPQQSIKIANLAAGTQEKDAVNVRQFAIGANSIIYDKGQGAVDPNTIKISLPKYIKLSPDDNGLRIFVYVSRTYNSGKPIRMLVIGEGAGMKCDIYDINYKLLTGLVFKDTMREFVFYRNPSGTNPLPSFHLIDTFANVADKTLSNVGTIDTDNSCIKDYVTTHTVNAKYTKYTSLVNGSYSATRYLKKIVNISWSYTLRVTTGQQTNSATINFGDFPFDNTLKPSFNLSDRYYCLVHSIESNRWKVGSEVSERKPDSFKFSIYGDSTTNSTFIIGFNLTG
ncbi:hypothetical protein AGMMS49936_09970 [Endomicrobiia bacterium]|nr:hypothetical protein AGMMS49936_09970 [Endomicrobiia bacterium]